MSALAIDNLSSVADMNAIAGGANVANIYKGAPTPSMVPGATGAPPTAAREQPFPSATVDLFIKHKVVPMACRK